MDLSDYMCTICMGILIEPVTMPCKHTMCKVSENNSRIAAFAFLTLFSTKGLLRKELGGQQSALPDVQETGGNLGPAQETRGTRERRTLAPDSNQVPGEGQTHNLAIFVTRFHTNST